jgi:IS605 OrfB family transposase
VQSVKTIRCKLKVTEDLESLLPDLFKLYAQACTHIAQWGRDHKEANSFRLHRALYKQIRKDFFLSANLAVTALRRAAGTLKTAHFKGRFEYRPTFVALDARTFRLILKSREVSFTTHKGRRRAALDIGHYQWAALASGNVQSAMLVHAKDGFWANIVVKSEIQDAALGGVLGVDLGIRNIAVTSTGRKFFGKDIREYREDRLRIRASLQSKGTEGAKRALKRLSGRERRHAAWVNHRIAKAIVGEAIKASCDRIALENLKGIRGHLRIPSKHLNRMVSLWSFFQLREFIRYKAAAKGIRIVEVDPAYTSQTCHKCLKRGIRDREEFLCTACGMTLDADENAARVIAARGAGAGENPAVRNAARMGGTGHRTS